MDNPFQDFPEAIIILDHHNQIIGVNPAGEELLKIKQADAVGKTADEVFPRQSFPVNFDELLADGRKEASLSRANGQTFYAELKVSSINASDGSLLGRIMIVRDLDQSHREAVLRNQNAILTALQETTFDLHSSLKFTVVLKNIVERACKLLGTPHGYLDILVEEADELVPVVGTGVLEETLGYKVKRGDGVSGTVWETGTPLVIADYDKWPGRNIGFRYGVIRAIVGLPLWLKDRVVGVFGVAQDFENEIEFSKEDVSILKRFADLASVALQNAWLFEKAQKEINFRRKTEVELRNANQLLQLQIERIELLQEKLKELAVRDSLTNLFNRRYLQEMLEVEFARSRRSRTSLAILMIDSDHLKDINDKYGHKAGDDFLVHIAEVLQSCIRAGDIACRYGGDEFVVVLSNVAVEIALERAEKLRESIAKHYIVYKNKKVSISVSIGIAAFPGHGSSGEVLLQKADQALYQAKQKGKNRIVVYSEERG